MVMIMQRCNKCGRHLYSANNMRFCIWCNLIHEKRFDYE